MLTQRQKEIILAFADCNMRLKTVAEKLYFHRNNIVYHCDKIMDKTGLNPRKFYDLVELVQMVEEQDG